MENHVISIVDLVIGGAAILGTFSTLLLLFVTRFEHKDVIGRISRLEDHIDGLIKKVDNQEEE